jgi:hypothetical protein
MNDKKEKVRKLLKEIRINRHPEDLILNELFHKFNKVIINESTYFYAQNYIYMEYDQESLRVSDEVYSILNMYNEWTIKEDIVKSILYYANTILDIKLTGMEMVNFNKNRPAMWRNIEEELIKMNEK